MRALTTKLLPWGVTCFLGFTVPALADEAEKAEESSAEETTPEAPKPKVVDFSVSDLGDEDPAPTSPFGPSRDNFRTTLGKLRQIAEDPEIVGLRLRVEGGLDNARSLDLMRELDRIRQAGKKIVCYAESLTRSDLVYSSVAELLATPPSAMIMLEGISAEVMYLKDMLDKVGVKLQVMHIGDFKTAFEDMSRNHMSEAQRETLQALMDEFYNQAIHLIAKNRGMPEATVQTLFDKVLVTPEEAEQVGLLTVAYEDQFDAMVETAFGGPIELVEDYGEEDGQDLEELMNNPFAFMQIMQDMLKPKKKKLPEGPKIAIVYCSGGIVSGKSTQGLTGQSMGSETIVEALEETLENDDIKAVVLRVNSPGGSALASDMIWRAVERVKEKKPVIASMGSVAASGGYWISMGCNKIIAQPSTITGSIGVVSALPDVTETLEKLGINVELVGSGPRTEDLAIMRNGVTPFLREKLTASMQNTYDTFLEKVAEGRGMTVEEVRPLAAGRVWTGRDAKEFGLVDSLGGLEDAIVVACHYGGRLNVDETPVLEYPEAPDFFEQLEESMGQFLQVRSPMREALELLGFDDVWPMIESLKESSRGLHHDMVQCILPFSVRIR